MAPLKAFQTAVAAKNVVSRYKAASAYTDEELGVLGIIKAIKPGYRAKELQENKLGEYSVSNPHIKSLINKGVIKVNSKGAIALNMAKAKGLFETEAPPYKYDPYHVFKGPRKA